MFYFVINLMSFQSSALVKSKQLMCIENSTEWFFGIQRKWDSVAGDGGLFYFRNQCRELKMNRSLCSIVKSSDVMLHVGILQVQTREHRVVIPSSGVYEMCCTPNCYRRVRQASLLTAIVKQDNFEEVHVFKPKYAFNYLEKV